MFAGLASRFFSAAVAMTVGGVLKACGKEKMANEIMNAVPIASSYNKKQMNRDSLKELAQLPVNKNHEFENGICNRCGTSSSFLQHFPAPCRSRK